MKTIKDLDIAGKTVFIRCDFNVPKDEHGNITDDRRIRGALTSIRYCLDRDCKVILASHYERPEPGVYEEKFSLAAVVTRLQTLLKLADNITLAKDVVGEKTKAKAAALESGEVCDYAATDEINNPYGKVISEIYKIEDGVPKTRIKEYEIGRDYLSLIVRKGRTRIG